MWPFGSIAALVERALGRDGRYLFFDLYHGDFGGKVPDFAAVARDRSWYGGILKATDGTWTPGGDWFRRAWPALRAAGGARYGRTWFRGAYLYLRAFTNGAAQAEHYVREVELAGGWDSGDMIPWVDAEQGSKDPSSSNKNDEASAAQWEDAIGSCIARLKQLTGQRVGYYGRGVYRDFKITKRLGADVLWNAAYTSTMPTNGYTPRALDGEPNSSPGPFELDHIALWQYAGDGDANGARDHLGPLPVQVPGLGPEDCNVFLDGGRRPTLARLREQLLRSSLVLELALAGVIVAGTVGLP